MDVPDDEELLRSVAIRNAKSVLAARQRAERVLLEAKEALELRTAELARSLAVVRATLESTTDGILVTDTSGKVTAFNEQYAKIWRLPREAVGSHRHPQLLEIVSGQLQDPSGFIARIECIYASAPPESYDLLELADGRVFERFSKLQFVNDQHTDRVWSFRDITERRRAEEALRDETQILELLNQTGVIIASNLDLQSLVQSVTDAATQLQ